MSQSTPTLWIYEEAENQETYQQVFAFQFRLRFFESFEAMNALVESRNFEKPSLIILDTSSSDRSAAEWLKFIHAELHSSARTLIVSRTDSLDQMRDLASLGAVDFLLKPLRPNELIFRSERALSEVLGGPIEILPSTVDGVSVPGLTFKERQLLAIFILQPERAVRRTDLFGAIWKNISVNKKTLDVHLFNLRRKLHPLGLDIVSQDHFYQLRKL